MLAWLPAVLVLLPWVFGPAEPAPSARILQATGPVSLPLLNWETHNLGERAPRLLAGLFESAGASPGDVETARAFLAAYPAARAGPGSSAESAIERLVADAYRAAGAERPLPLLGERLFPPVLVALAPPPNVLVVSPRDALVVVQSVVLDDTLTESNRAALERSADSTGVSSLVTPIGGLATYPSMVPDTQAPRDVLSSVAHEWLHQYLVFFPLGSAYFGSQEAREINETTADLVGREIGDEVADRLGLPPGAARSATEDPGFRQFMRTTRLEVERLLQAGQVVQAEGYMERRRQELAGLGYRIRKLNQAYFAFYGSYGDSAAASPRSPVPALLRRLRDESPSLGAFLDRIQTVTTVSQLRAAVESP